MDNKELIEELKLAGYREDHRILLRHQKMIGICFSFPGLLFLILGTVFAICGNTNILNESFRLIGGITCGTGALLLVLSAVLGMFQGPPKSPVTGNPMEINSVQIGNAFYNVYVCHEGKVFTRKLKVRVARNQNVMHH